MKTLCCFSSPIVNLPVVTSFSCKPRLSAGIQEEASGQAAFRTSQNLTSFWMAAFSGSTFCENATLLGSSRGQQSWRGKSRGRGDALGLCVFVPAEDLGVVRQRRELLVERRMHLVRLTLEEAPAAADEERVAGRARQASESESGSARRDVSRLTQ